MAWHLGAAPGEGGAERLLARLVLSAFLSMGVMVASLALYSEYLPSADATDMSSSGAAAMRGLYRMAALALATPVVLLLGAPLMDAVARTRRYLSTDALILLGTLAAYSVSIWNTLIADGPVYYETATMVLVLFTLGRWLDVRTKDRARSHLDAIVLEATPSVTRVAEGEESEVSPDLLNVGDLLRMRPGQVLGVDGRVEAGASFVNTAALTGEGRERRVAAGERILAGSTLVDGSLLVRVEATEGSRVRDQVDRLLARALEEKGRYVHMADRLAAVLLPLVLLLAIGTAVWHWPQVGAEQALMHALAVVLISCPCALGLATPLAFWTALGAAWKAGILVRGADVMERLDRVSQVLFDKTGTLTADDLSVVGIELSSGTSRSDALLWTAAIEVGSEHAIGRALVRAWSKEAAQPAAVDRPDQASQAVRSPQASLGDLPQVTEFRALPGVGVEGRIAGEMHSVRRDARGGREADPHTRVALQRGDQVLAIFKLSAVIAPEAADVLAQLSARGYACEMLTGDDEGPARHVAGELGLPFHCALLPSDKAQIISEREATSVAFVGDGLNDAAALATAAVGVAVCGSSPRTLAVADVHLLRAGLADLPFLLALAGSAVRTARMNLLWACSYNAMGLCLAVAGQLTPIVAAAAMVCSSLAVVFHSRRAANVSGVTGSSR